MAWSKVFGSLALTGGCLIGSAALAEDWQIATLSGKAFRLDGTAWVAVAANEPIAIGDTVKTLGSGTLTLTRSGVTVTIAPNSRVQLSERMDGKFTDVFLTAGSTAVEVDPKKHIRLAVETPYMAAVVKGTVFAVSTFEGYSQTSVQRGRVAVIDVANRLHADVTAGQTATSGAAQPLSLSGVGTLATPEAFAGKVMTRAADGTLSEASSATTSDSTTSGAGKSASSNAGGNSNGAGNSENSNAGGNGKSNSSSNSNSSSSSSNAGGNSDGAGNSENSHAGGNGKSQGNSESED